MGLLSSPDSQQETMTTNLALCFQYVPSAFLLTLSTSLIEIGSRSSVTYGLPYGSAGGTRAREATLASPSCPYRLATAGAW